MPTATRSSATGPDGAARRRPVPARRAPVAPQMPSAKHSRSTVVGIGDLEAPGGVPGRALASRGGREPACVQLDGETVVPAAVRAAVIAVFQAASRAGADV